MTDCGREPRLDTRAAEVAIGAFMLAMAEFGILPHPGGACPVPGCRCLELAGAIETRATELAAAGLGIPAAELGVSDLDG